MKIQIKGSEKRITELKKYLSSYLKIKNLKLSEVKEENSNELELIKLNEKIFELEKENSSLKGQNEKSKKTYQKRK